MKIYHSEAKTGYDNWYKIAGLIYYYFMRTKYMAVS